MTELIDKTAGPSGAASLLSDLIEPEAYVGEVYSLGYEEALVQIQDADRQRVGGIPALSFLAATRINPKKNFDINSEDASVILLRVMDRGEMPSDEEFTRLRLAGAKRVSGDFESLWDDEAIVDPILRKVLSYTGVRCRVMGTFYIEQERLVFGSDLSNYYPNSALKVFKLRGKPLEKVVNYRHPGYGSGDETSFTIGEVRYASTNRPSQNVSGVPVTITPTDLLNQRTALFGMSRTGKSNTTKIILESIFQLRWKAHGRKIGQLVFDPNGEYTNENVQDKGKGAKSDAVVNVWMKGPVGRLRDAREEVVTYGTVPHPNDRDRRLMRLDFYADRNLQVGKDIIDAIIAGDSSKYISNFRDVRLDRLEDVPGSEEIKRHKRMVLYYRALLFRAGLTPPKDTKPETDGLFDKELLRAMTESGGKNASAYGRGAALLVKPDISWNQIAASARDLCDFVRDRDSGFGSFDNDYVERSVSQSSWASEDLMKILEMFKYSNGPKIIGRVREQHGIGEGLDYAEDIYAGLKDGRLVIIDQSGGDAELNGITAERVMERIFEGNKADFRTGVEPREILIYIEEAHNLLPAAEYQDLSNVWIRTAKEGAKYHLGLIYATQEVSSIQKNVLRNTANWFIGHLNNTDETRELNKFYDFADFERSILRTNERGFLRTKTMSNPYIVPVQINKFTVDK